MWRAWVWARKLFNKPQEPVKTIEPKRTKVDTPAIRARMATQGWKLLEVPIKRCSRIAEERQVIGWKIVGQKNGRSVEVSGTTLDEAIKTLGKTLGVISQET